jgi:transcription elongation factor GreA
VIAMLDTKLTWLTRQGHEHIRDELNRLVLAYRSAEYHHKDSESQAQREWQERRIRQLQELLLTAKVGMQPPDDGIAEPGMVLTVRYAESDDTETFLLASREVHVCETMEVYSPDSPLGHALLGARENDKRDYLVPNGGTMSVTLIKAQPFRDKHQLASAPEARRKNHFNANNSSDCCGLSTRE